MEIIRHKTAAEFLLQAGHWLEEAEAENNLILGIAAFFKSYAGQPKIDPYYFTVQNDGMIVGASMMTPPRRLLISRMPDPAMVLLADYLLAEKAPVPGVLGPKDCARVFAGNWIVKTGLSSRARANLRLRSGNSASVEPWFLTDRNLRRRITTGEMGRRILPGGPY